QLRARPARGHARQRGHARGRRHPGPGGAGRPQGDRDRLRRVLPPAPAHPHRGHGPRLRRAWMAAGPESRALNVAGAGTGTLLFLGVAGALLASMVPYALGGARRDRDVQGKDAHFAGGAGDFLLHWFMWAISPLVALSLRLGLSPDFFNYAG